MKVLKSNYSNEYKEKRSERLRYAIFKSKLYKKQLTK